MPTLFERAGAWLIKKMIGAHSVDGDPRVITLVRQGTSYPLKGWIGRGMQSKEALTGQLIQISEREFFFAVADMQAAGLGEPRRGDRLQVAGESWVWEVLDPATLGEPAWRYANSERTWFRIHTAKLVN